MLVELNFLRQVRIQHGDACAAIVGEKVFIVPQRAQQDWDIHVFAIQVAVAFAVTRMACFENHIDDLAQWFDQFDEQLKQSLFRCRAHEYWHVRLALFITIHVVTVALAGSDFQIKRRTNRVRQHEVAVFCDGKVSFKLFRREVLEAALV